MLADDLLAELASAVRKAGGLVTVITDPAEPPPLPADVVVASTGASSAFHETALDGLLRRAGRTDLLLAGWGLEGPVHSTMREANDRGYECLLVPDACTSLDAALVEPACSMVRHSGGIFGAFAPARAVLAALVGPASGPAPTPVVSPSLEAGVSGASQRSTP